MPRAIRKLETLLETNIMDTALTKDFTIGSPHPRTKNDQGDQDGTSGIQPPTETTEQRSPQTERVDEQVVTVIRSQNVGSVVL